MDLFTLYLLGCACSLSLCVLSCEYKLHVSKFGYDELGWLLFMCVLFVVLSWVGFLISLCELVSWFMDSGSD